VDRILSTVWADKEIAVKLLIKEPRKSRRSFSFVNKNLNSYVEVMPYFRVATRLAKVRTKYVVTSLCGGCVHSRLVLDFFFGQNARSMLRTFCKMPDYIPGPIIYKSRKCSDF
jgi:hypothetical protein